MTSKISLMEPVNERLDRLDPNLVDELLAEHGYLVVKNADLKAIVLEAREEYFQVQAIAPMHPHGEKFTYKQLCELEYWKKAAISSSSGLGEAYGQSVLTTYLSPKSNRYPSLRKLFSMMCIARNRLMRVEADFGYDPQNDRFWNASRIHHYPQGGGFMGEHRDTYFPLALKDKPFYQVAVLLSRKGVDFSTGGGFVISKQNDRKVDLETEGGFGCAVIFDGKTIHGVDAVDEGLTFDLSSPKGRIAAFANVYVFQDN
jgi:hypothetical protein